MQWVILSYSLRHELFLKWIISLQAGTYDRNSFNDGHPDDYAAVVAHCGTFRGLSSRKHYHHLQRPGFALLGPHAGRATALQGQASAQVQAVQEGGQPTGEFISVHYRRPLAQVHVQEPRLAKVCNNHKMYQTDIICNVKQPMVNHVVKYHFPSEHQTEAALIMFCVNGPENTVCY